MCQNPRFWDLLLEGLGRKDLGEDSRFSDLESRLQNRDALTTILDEIFSTQSSDEWINQFKGIIPIAPVYDMAQALDNPFVQEIDMINEVDHPDRPGLRVLNNPIRINGKRVPLRKAPKLGEDTDDVLRDIGYTDDDIAKLHESGTV